MRLYNLAVDTVMLRHFVVDSKHHRTIVSGYESTPNRTLYPLDAYMRTLGDRVVAGVVWHITFS